MHIVDIGLTRVQPDPRTPAFWRATAVVSTRDMDDACNGDTVEAESTATNAVLAAKRAVVLASIKLGELLAAGVTVDMEPRARF